MVNKSEENQEKTNYRHSGLKSLVDYKYISRSEISDYSRFLLDLRWQENRGKDTFTFQEFPIDLKTSNNSLKKRNSFMLEPYNRKKVDSYLIKAYTIGLLEINDKPFETRKKIVAKISTTREGYGVSKKQNYLKVIDTTYIKSKVLMAYPFMDIYRIRVINYLKRLLINNFDLKNEKDMIFALENNDFRETLIEKIFNSIPTEYLNTDIKVLELFIDFIKYFNKMKSITYSGSSKANEKNEKKLKIAFVKKEHTFKDIPRFLRSTFYKKNNRNLINPYFNLREELIYSTYNYNFEDSKSAVYKKFRRDIIRNFREGNISNKDKLYIEKRLNMVIRFNEFKTIK